MLSELEEATMRWDAVDNRWGGGGGGWGLWKWGTGELTRVRVYGGTWGTTRLHFIRVCMSRQELKWKLSTITFDLVSDLCANCVRYNPNSLTNRPKALFSALSYRNKTRHMLTVTDCSKDFLGLQNIKKNYFAGHCQGNVQA